MTTLIVGNTKGGSGKTTTTLFIAQEIHNRGYKVVVVDADQQTSATQWAKAADLPFTVLPVSDPKKVLQFLKDNEGKNFTTIIDVGPTETRYYQEDFAGRDDVLYLVPSKATVMDWTRAVKTMAEIENNGGEVLPLLTMVNTRTRSYKALVSHLGQRLKKGMLIKHSEAYAAASHQKIKNTLDYTHVVNALAKGKDQWTSILSK